MPRERYSKKEQEYYRAYLQSPAWRRRKDARLARAKYQCEFVTTRCDPVLREVRCTRTSHLCVHHNTYKRLGMEQDTDLDVFCWFHHMIEHLLWKKCNLCGEPCLGNDEIAELWLRATLAQDGIDPDDTSVPWRRLPTKEKLAEQIFARCPRCRRIDLNGIIKGEPNGSTPSG